jgi:hypothetical protein
MNQRTALAIAFLIIGVAYTGVPYTGVPYAVVPYASAQQASTADAVLLRWKFSQGQQYDIVLEQETKQQMSLPTQEMTVSNRMTTMMTWVVKSVDDDGTANLVQIIGRVQMSVDSPQGKIQFDSQDEEHAPAAAQMARIFEPIIGVDVELTMNDRGEIVDVVFPERALEGVKANPLAAQLMTPEAVKEMTGKASPVLPEGPTGIGQVWLKEGTTSTPVGKLTVKNKYTYEGKSPTNSSVDVIRVDMEMGFVPGENAVGPKIEVTDQDNSGIVTFNVVEGYLSGSELTQRMSLQIQAAGQSIDQNVQSTTRMTVTPSS